jgi:hypothetical protein
MGVVSLIILGAGLSGLLAARRLWKYKPSIYEKQDALPNNHSALLRFRSHEVGEAIGIPFKKVRVFKGILQDDYRTITSVPNLRDINAYSLKSTGYALERSIINTETSTRFIAPHDLIGRLAHSSTIQYSSDAQGLTPEANPETVGAIVISTIPMPELMKILNYKNISYESFKTRSIWTINCYLYNVDVYQTLYVPYGPYHPYRVSITGNRMTLEFASEPDGHAEGWIEAYINLLFPMVAMSVEAALSGSGVAFDSIVMKQQHYGKIVPINNFERQRFILWATDNFNIYSLGRYATWRQILLDDVLKDIGVIDKFIEQRGDSYNRARHWS